MNEGTSRDVPIGPLPVAGSALGVLRGDAMSTVDGYIAEDNDDVGPLFEWYVNGDAELVDGGPARCARRRRTT